MLDLLSFNNSVEMARAEFYMKSIIDISTAEKYNWAEQCFGWHLLKSEQLSVIQERVGPGKSERRYYHKEGKQFFFIFSGSAVLEIEGTEYCLSALQGLAVEPLEKHTFKNTSSTDAEFIVVTSPKLDNDLVNRE